MITRIRDVRKAKGMTLDDVARRCDPPTTAQTIGRLETGMRTVSVGWLNRIAAALGVSSADLVNLPGQDLLPVAALIGPDGAHAPAKSMHIAPPVASGDIAGVRVTASIGDYRGGDEIWCARIAPADYAGALNRDVLVPRPGGRFLFGRLIGRDAAMIHLLPLGARTRQQVLADPPWIGVATRLVRAL
ncbi:helix-turn-helix domain-containing protein [Sphingobium algorifonticola]|uniref:XRE family transcriptional regulator n=1 Tax=Sphingobium algorifonticola TaxID=2008318 RepID=A0A437J4W5_9SPHN|nr:helix-turn-helix transcriptional regulator [Sphingobium algorifonticola]RVT39799.1 XRE family transcriptional regulator [Sphingobium algorifonticola]